jgi:cell wall-associated NlpC family hydrolase
LSKSIKIYKKTIDLPKFMPKMKKITTILSTCIALLFMGSCAVPKPMGKTAQSSNQPEFIDGVTLNGGSNNLRLTQKKQVYRNQGVNTLADDVETAETGSFAKSRIQEGKKRNQSLYSFIEEWYGTPYRFGGTSKLGIDCSAFTQQLFNAVYHMDLVRTSVEQFSNAIYIAKEHLKEGDLVFFKIRSKRISHVGVYLGDGKFVHSSVSRGVVISDLDENYWTRYYAGAGRMS